MTASDDVDGGPALLPDIDKDEVRCMIMAGAAPPEAWRPFIKEIAFDKRWPVPSLEPLAALTNLEILYFERGRYWPQHESRDIGPIGGLVRLHWLMLPELPVADIKPISGLTNLVRLDLYNTPLSNISPLANLSKLEWLHLSGTRVSDLRPVAGLSALRLLDLDRTEVSDVAPLAKLSNLNMLNLCQTKVKDVTPLCGLTNLAELWLADTAVGDLTPLSALTNLKRIVLGPHDDDSGVRHIDGIKVGRYADGQFTFDGDWGYSGLAPP